MTGFIEITAINPKIQYVASSGQTVFDYPFIAFTDDDLSVYVNGTLTTAFTATTLYPSEGGTVTLASGATLSDVITIMRNTPVIKDTGYTTGGEFRASTIDYQYAKFIAILQQLVRDLLNTAKLSPSTTLTGGITLPEPEDGKSFKWFGVSGAIVNTDNDVDEVVNTATAQAVIATTQAGLATTAAVNAATSETNAQGYASTSSTAKDDALLAQTAAESARDLAQGYAAAADVAKIEWQGVWSAGSYNEHDAVEHNGTSYISTTTTTEEPSISATDWDVLALKGTNGIGSGDVTSSISSSTDGSLVVFDGAGGKTVKQQATGAAGTVLKSNGTTPIYDLPVPTAAAGGTVDAITATYTTGVVALSDGMLVRVTAAGANTGATTFAPNGLTAHAVTKLGGTALSAGDIYDAGHELLLAYNLANTRWELLNPAVTASSSVFTQSFTSAAQTLSASSIATIAHGLGVVPKMVYAYAICTTAEYGYAVGDRIDLGCDPCIYWSGGSGYNSGFTINTSAANLIITVGLTAPAVIMSKLNYQVYPVTAANWRFYFQAFA